MWDDFEIGSIDVKMTTAISLISMENGFNISQNSKSYWITDLFLGLSGIIHKNSPEGTALKEMIDRNAPFKDIQKYLDKIAFANTPLDKLYSKIEYNLKDAYERGQMAKIMEIKSALFNPTYNTL